MPDSSPTAPNLPTAPRALADWVAQREDAQPGLKPGNAARVHLHEPAAPARTAFAVVYLHGFTASPGECAQQPELLAQALSANAFVARLPGHGLGADDAMVGITTAHWLAAAEEALAIGRRLGERVVLVGTSLGAGLATWLAARNPDVAAVVAWSLGASPVDPAQLDQVCAAQGVLHDPRPRSDAQLRFWSRSVHVDGFRALREFMGTQMTHAMAASVRAPYFLAYYYADDTHQDPTASVTAMRAFFSALGTPPTQRRERAFANGTHAIASPWRSDAADEVMRETLAFLAEALPRA